MAISKNNRAPGARSRNSSTKTRPAPARHLRTEVEALFGRFNDGLAIVKVAAAAIRAAEQFNNECITLEIGITALDRVYTELDVALSGGSATAVRVDGRRA